MVFQLELHDIPEEFHEDDFLVQISLRVGNTESSVVPRDLDKASMAGILYILGYCMHIILLYVYFIRVKLFDYTALD